MQIDWLAFSPGPAFFGEILLGIAAALYVILHGRILGISGIVSGLLSPKEGDVSWLIKRTIFWGAYFLIFIQAQ